MHIVINILYTEPALLITTSSLDSVLIMDFVNFLTESNERRSSFLTSTFAFSYSQTIFQQNGKWHFTKSKASTPNIKSWEYY